MSHPDVEDPWNPPIGTPGTPGGSTTRPTAASRSGWPLASTDVRANGLDLKRDVLSGFVHDGAIPGSVARDRPRRREPGVSEEAEDASACDHLPRVATHLGGAKGAGGTCEVACVHVVPGDSVLTGGSCRAGGTRRTGGTCGTRRTRRTRRARPSPAAVPVAEDRQALALVVSATRAARRAHTFTHALSCGRGRTDHPGRQDQRERDDRAAGLPLVSTGHRSQRGPCPFVRTHALNPCFSRFIRTQGELDPCAADRSSRSTGTRCGSWIARSARAVCLGQRRPGSDSEQ